MKRTHRQPCGCLSTVGEREAWLELCPPHKTEADELHARAAREHLERRDEFYSDRSQEVRR